MVEDQLLHCRPRSQTATSTLLTASCISLEKLTGTPRAGGGASSTVKPAVSALPAVLSVAARPRPALCSKWSSRIWLMLWAACGPCSAAASSKLLLSRWYSRQTFFCPQLLQGGQLLAEQFRLSLSLGNGPLSQFLGPVKLLGVPVPFQQWYQSRIRILQLARSPALDTSIASSAQGSYCSF